MNNIPIYIFFNICYIWKENIKIDKTKNNCIIIGLYENNDVYLYL